MLNLTTQINKVLDKNQVPHTDRPKVTQLMVAEFVAAKLPIPTSPTNELRTLFITQHKLAAVKSVGLVNERLVIDIDQTVELVFKVWRIRYMLVHRPNHHSIGRLITLALTSKNIELSPEFKDIIDRNSNAFLDYYVFDELNEAGELNE